MCKASGIGKRLPVIINQQVSYEPLKRGLSRAGEPGIRFVLECRPQLDVGGDHDVDDDGTMVGEWLPMVSRRGYCDGCRRAQCPTSLPPGTAALWMVGRPTSFWGLSRGCARETIHYTCLSREMERLRRSSVYWDLGFRKTMLSGCSCCLPVPVRLVASTATSPVVAPATCVDDLLLLQREPRNRADESGESSILAWQACRTLVWRTTAVHRPRGKEISETSGVPSCHPSVMSCLALVWLLCLCLCVRMQSRPTNLSPVSVRLVRLFVSVNPGCHQLHLQCSLCESGTRGSTQGEDVVSRCPREASSQGSVLRACRADMHTKTIPRPNVHNRGYRK